MSVKRYFSEVAAELHRESERVKLGFSTHAPSAGGNREGIVRKFLVNNLPKKFGVASGLLLSRSGEFSKEADAMIVDLSLNVPLFPAHDKELWLIESVYALFEVKTYLGPTDIADAITKCRCFKSLPREFDDCAPPVIRDSLFVIWAFSSAQPKIAKANVCEALKGVPRDEQPDMIIVPDSFLITCGQYLELSVLGQPNSARRRALAEAGLAPNVKLEPEEALMTMDLGSNALLVFLMYLLSWLKRAGSRSAKQLAYIGRPGELFGNLV